MNTILKILKYFCFYFTFLFILLVILNIFSHLILKHNKGENPVITKYGLNNLAKAYPNVTAETVKEILNETWNKQVIYSSYVQFQEPQRSGEHVNISEHGFRLNQQAKENPFPLDSTSLNIFVFGGSTTFGYGVRDHETIPAYLETKFRQDGIKANIYNFGRAFYFSTQERILFEKLVLEGHAPNLAIFIDGLNEFYHPGGNPTFTGILNGAMDYSFYYAQKRFFREMPIVNLVRFYRDSILKPSPRKSGKNVQQTVQPEEKIVNKILSNYLTNTQIIAALSKEFNINTHFVWQPVPEYGMDLSTHPYYNYDELQPTANRKQGYLLAKQLFNKQIPDVIWAANLAENCQGNFVDKVHYSAKFNNKIASAIYSRISAN